MQKNGYRRRKKSRGRGEGRKEERTLLDYHLSSSKRGRVIYMCVLQL